MQRLSRLPSSFYEPLDRSVRSSIDLIRFDIFPRHAACTLSGRRSQPMKRWISTCAVAAAFAVTTHAQDSTTTTKTQIKADDAKAITATGCLVPGLALDVY